MPQKIVVRIRVDYEEIDKVLGEMGFYLAQTGGGETWYMKDGEASAEDLQDVQQKIARHCVQVENAEFQDD